MNIPDIIIAVDGYSSTGKSTFAKLVAQEFGFLYLDSGAMYRGVTLAGLEAGATRCEHPCPTLPVWEKLGQLVDSYLDSVSLADLLSEK